MSKPKLKLWLVIFLSCFLLYGFMASDLMWSYYIQSQSSVQQQRPLVQWIASFSNTKFYRFPENRTMESSRNLRRTVMFFNEPLNSGNSALRRPQVNGDSFPPERQQIKHRPIFNYIHTADNCSDDVEIFIAVCSAGQNKDQRQTIRNTWGRDATNNSAIKLVFFEGRSLNPSIQEDIARESRLYNDIVQEDFIDRYQNLSLKSISYLRWVSTRCANVKFVLKTDDDMYVNIPVLVETLAQEKHSKFIMGYVFEHAPPMRSKKSKWFTSVDAFPGKEYPPYVSGTSYVVSGDLIPELYSESFNQRLFWLEDVFVTGFLAQAVNATRIHSNKFSFSQRPKKGCYYKNSISGHHISPRNMRKIYRELKNPKLTCVFLVQKDKLVSS